MPGPVPQLNAYTCNLIRRRAKFLPARIDGNPSYGVYRTAVFYTVADDDADLVNNSHSDIDVVVKALPEGLKSPVSVAVAFAVDGAGEKSSCDANNGDTSERVVNHPALVGVGCGEVLNTLRVTPVTHSGQPVVSVQNALVEFTALASLPATASETIP